MSMRRLILVLGAVALIASVVALVVPVSVSGSNGERIGCGNAIVSDLSQARQADDQNPANLPIISQLVPHTNYVADCQSSLSQRRAWSIPLAVLGAIALVGAWWARFGDTSRFTLP